MTSARDPETGEFVGVEKSWIEDFEFWIDGEIEKADQRFRNMPLPDTAVPPLLLKLVRGKLQQFKRGKPTNAKEPTNGN